MPKFQIGDIVYNTVQKRGSYEPSVCSLYTKLEVDKVERGYNGDFTYTCGYDGYRFKESELLSAKEYAEKIASGKI